MNSRGYCQSLCTFALGTLFCISHNPLWGQITYTYADAQAAFSVGTINTIAEVAGAATVFVGSPSGSAQLWNFSGLTFLDIGTSTVITTSSAPGAAGFPAANSCFRMDTLGSGPQTTSTYTFYNLSSSALTFHGIADASGSLLIRVRPPSPEMQFPLSLGSTWPYTSTPETTEVAPGFSTITSRTSTHTVDAFGTLRLPTGDFAALRIKKVDLITTSMPPLTSYSVKTITYSFMNKEGAIVTVTVDSTQENLSTVNVTDAITYTRPGRSTATGDEPASIPRALQLEQNYPNPFNPETGIRYQVPGVSEVRLAIFDLLGREIMVLVDEKKQAGQYEVKFSGVGLPTGVYIYRLSAGESVQCRKMVLMK